MKVVLGSDHAGFELKELVRAWLEVKGYEVQDVGTHSSAAVDYPDFAAAVGHVLIHKRAERGILICGSGVGACIAANKIVGVRACVCHDVYSAHQGVEHDDMNCLVLGARVIGSALALDLVCSYLDARFTNEPRHQRRLDKVLALEKNLNKRS